MSVVAIAGADFLVASYDGIHLLFHERDVRGVEMVDRLEALPSEAGGALLYPRGDDECLVFALDTDLKVLPKLPARRQHFILLAGAGGDFGIACDQASRLRHGEAQLMPLPECMQSPLSPIREVTLIADAVGFYCDPSALAARLLPHWD